MMEGVYSERKYMGKQRKFKECNRVGRRIREGILEEKEKVR